MNLPATPEEDERSRRTVVVSGLIEENVSYTLLVLEMDVQGVIVAYLRIGEGMLAVEMESVEVARRLVKMGGTGGTPLGVFTTQWGTGYIPVQSKKRRKITNEKPKKRVYDIDGFVVPGYLNNITRQAAVVGAAAAKSKSSVSPAPESEKSVKSTDDLYEHMLEDKANQSQASIRMKEQILNEKKRQRELEEEEILEAKKRKEEEEAALAVEALQRRLRLHMDSKEKALEEESDEEKARREFERRKQEEELRLENEEKLAKLNKQKEEKAKLKAEEKAKKEAAKRQKAEEKRLKQAYKDYSTSVAEKKKKGKYKPSPWCMETEKEFTNLYSRHLPEDPLLVSNKIRQAYLNHREITASLKMHLCTLSTDCPVEYLKVLTEIFKLGGILQTEMAEKTADILAKLLDNSESGVVTSAKKYIQEEWKDCLSPEQLKAFVATVTALLEARLQKEKEEQDRKAQEKLLEQQMGYYQYQNNQQGGVAQQGQQYPQYPTQYQYPQNGAPTQGQHAHYQYPYQYQQPAAASPALPANWVASFDAATNRPYYYNSITKETSWVAPEA
eukprot:TRINITY_DN25977_c0_g1_i2.p1 TRINITY_DN25977_c0_g1~~TRINITY_DN25977_c0_g1_i2.p1  ORF type:complete len:558 (+),score=108.79 TRINITY_DN25977_c0_g1_i2:63-1736(+)